MVWTNVPRAWAALAAFMVSAFVAPPGWAGDWPGWRGGDRYGAAASTDCPTDWTPVENVKWRTDIVGEGHSSPIVTGDAVYLSSARLLPADEVGVNLFRAGLAALATVLVVLALSLATCPARADRWGTMCWCALVPTVGSTMFAGAAWFIAMHSEGFLHFARGPERGWGAGSILGTVLLSSSAMVYTATRLRNLPAAISLLAFAAVVQAIVPEPQVAYAGGLLSAMTAYHLAVVAIPLVVGLWLLGRDLTGHGPSTGEPREPSRSQAAGKALKAVGGLGMAGMVVGTVVLVALEQRATTSTLSVTAPYEPAIHWAVLLAGALTTVVVLLAQPRIRPTWLGNLLVVGVVAAFGVVLAGSIFERLVANSPYLNYQLGVPDSEPLVRTAWGWAVVVICAMIAMPALWRHSLRRHAIAYHVIGSILAVGFLGYAVYVRETPRLVRTIACFDRVDGTARWTSEGVLGPQQRMHSDNSPATPTPASDGASIYAWFGTPGLLCVDTEGATRWLNTDLPFDTRHGVSTSPVLCEGSVIILSESETGKYLASVDCETGQLRWRTERNESIHPHAGNCRTPTLHEIGGQLTIVVWGETDLSGYDPDSGVRLWRHSIGNLGKPSNPVATAACDGQRLYLVGTKEALAVDIEDLPVEPLAPVWRVTITNGAQCCSPVVARGLFFAVSDNGVLHCLDCATGAELWTQRFGGQHYASLAAAGDRVYCTATSGVTRVVEAAPEFALAAENALDEKTFASMAIAGDELFIRTDQALYCIAR